MSEYLTDEDREAVCICAEASRDDRTETETIGLCNAHFSAIEDVVARHVAAALNEAADEIHEQGQAVVNGDLPARARRAAYRDAARIVRNLAANDGPQDPRPPERWPLPIRRAGQTNT